MIQGFGFLKVALTLMLMLAHYNTIMMDAFHSCWNHIELRATVMVRAKVSMRVMVRVTVKVRIRAGVSGYNQGSGWGEG